MQVRYKVKHAGRKGMLRSDLSQCNDALASQSCLVPFDDAERGLEPLRR